MERRLGVASAGRARDRHDRGLRGRPSRRPDARMLRPRRHRRPVPPPERPGRPPPPHRRTRRRPVGGIADRTGRARAACWSSPGRHRPAPGPSAAASGGGRSDRSGKCVLNQRSRRIPASSGPTVTNFDLRHGVRSSCRPGSAHWPRSRQRRKTASPSRARTTSRRTARPRRERPTPGRRPRRRHARPAPRPGRRRGRRRRRW